MFLELCVIAVFFVKRWYIYKFSAFEHDNSARTARNVIKCKFLKI